MAHHDAKKAEIHLRRTVVITLATLLLLYCAVGAAKPSSEPCPVHAGAWSSAGQLRSLIAAGADVNEVDELGDTCGHSMRQLQTVVLVAVANPRI